ncbi:LL-diaminopimelate aminotransferase [Sediminispirochaeta bajacaliforniensis]|uniref:LL-diaminopimelate aminotransferase n=1 Tax=Sediminispirochaeta bajacaliforniensis TaxID=148 RepID=UPI00036FC9B1|nr:LL-diaminopimelate aminotransferase [Sediminispirochaeta bajacaliforniensis]
MAHINEHYRKLSAGYLFPEIARRSQAFLKSHPDRKLLKLGIGNTTEPITPSVIEGLHRGVEKLASPATYTGYGDEQGQEELRKALGDFYAARGVKLAIDEFFISDGAKPDSGNIQSIFGIDNIVAVQDPAYPVYVDSNVISGRTGSYDKGSGRYEGIYYMPCNSENGFFPEVPDTKVDLIYLCSPNNPTGAVATREQLAAFIDYAIKNKAVIIYDASYAEYISDEALPKSIFEIEGAKKCAIEINSLSKFSGFTGVRLGWSIVPKELTVEGSEAGALNSLWNRRQCTFFNGASNIVQEGALAVFSPKGIEESNKLVAYYMENARIIREGLQSLGLTVFGGDNAPYLWLQTPGGMSSWDFFDKLIEETNVVGTPGSGFGPAGEGYFRLSAFGHREDIIRAVESIKSNLKL